VAAARLGGWTGLVAGVLRWLGGGSEAEEEEVGVAAAKAEAAEAEAEPFLAYNEAALRAILHVLRLHILNQSG